MPRRLTKRIVDALEARGSRYEIYDEELPGFLVRVTPSGEKIFGVLYRAGSGRTAAKRRITLGRFGVLTVDEARALARQNLAAVAHGKDPASERGDLRRAATVETFSNEFLSEVKARLKKSTAREYERILKKYVLPSIGNLRVQEVGTAHIARLHRSLRETPYQANRALAVTGTLLTHAEKLGLRPRGSNPCSEIKQYRESPRERFLSPKEMIRLGDSLTLAEGIGIPRATIDRSKSRGMSAARKARITGVRRGPYKRKETATVTPLNPVAIAAIRFLLLSGWRVSEALNLRWSNLSEDLGTAILPDSKTGRSVRNLGAPARQILASLPRMTDETYAFTGVTTDRPLAGLDRAWRAIREYAGLEGVRLHDLRHSYASVVASGGGSLLVIGKLLGHKQASTTARYAHLLDDPVRNAAERASGEIAALLLTKKRQDQPPHPEDKYSSRILSQGGIQESNEPVKRAGFNSLNCKRR